MKYSNPFARSKKDRILSNIKISFIDPIGYYYDHKISHEKPLGGSQALAATLAYYLTVEGYEIKFYTNGSHNYNLDNINYIGLNNGIQNGDFFIIVNHT